MCIKKSERSPRNDSLILQPSSHLQHQCSPSENNNNKKARKKRIIMFLSFFLDMQKLEKLHCLAET